VQFGGTLNIVLQSTTDDPVETGFDPAAGGVLNFTLANGFAQSLGESFSIFQFATDFSTVHDLSGSFSAIKLPSLNGR
jgi:hypothetical protein